MARKKKQAAEPEPEVVPRNAHLVISESYQHNGRWMEPGTEISIHGVKGRCRFIQHVRNLNTETEWIECYSIDKQFRAFYPERIKTVHYTVRTRENSNG